MSYASLSTVKTTLGITTTANDAALTAQINGAVAFIERYTGRNLSGTARTATDESHDFAPINARKDHTHIFLKNIDIQSVTSVTVDGTALAAADYKWDVGGRLTLEGYAIRRLVQSYNDIADIKVTYTYAYSENGTVTTPESVNQAIISAVRNMYSAKASNISSEKIGDYEIKYGGNSGGGGGSGSGDGSIWSADILMMLDAYKWYR